MSLRIAFFFGESARFPNREWASKRKVRRSATVENSRLERTRFRSVSPAMAFALAGTMNTSYKSKKSPKPPGTVERQETAAVVLPSTPISRPLPLMRGSGFVRRSQLLSWKVRSARDRTIRTLQIGVRSEFFQTSGIFARKFKKDSENFQHFLKYRLEAKFRQIFIKIWAKISGKNSK